MSKTSLRDKASQFFIRNKRRNYFKIISLSLLLILVIAYNILFTPAVVEKIIKSQFEKFTNGKISLHVLKASLLRGFSIENIEILSGEDFSQRPLLKLDKLNIFYSVYGFFAGDFGFHEIGLYNPRVFLYHKGDAWNVSTLMKSSPEKTEKKEEPPEKESSNSLNLPVKIRTFIKFVLNDFKMTITDLNPGGGDTLEAGIKDFTFRTYIITHKFSKIPYNINALDLFKSVIVNLDPQKTIDVYYKNTDSRLKSPLDLHWLVTFDENLKDNGFFSRLEIGHQDIPMEYKGKHLLPLNFGIDYDVKYNPSTDQLNFNYFRLTFAQDIWMNIIGNVNQVSGKKGPVMDLSLNKSNIDIGKIYPYFKAFTGNENLSFNGEVSLAPLKISGSLNDLSMDGKIGLYKVNVYKDDNNFSFSYLDLYYKTIIDKDLEKSPVPKVKNLEVNWNGSLNNSALGANIKYSFNELVNVYMYAHNFNVTPFSGDMVNGIFDLDFHLNGKNEKNMISTLDLKSNRFTYYVGRGVSGVNKLNLQVLTNFIFPGDGFSTVHADVKEINLALNNEKNRKGIALLASVLAKKSSEDINIDFDLKNLSANLNNLKSMVPGTYREQIENLAENTEKDIRLNGNTHIYNKDDYSLLENTTNLFIDDLDINDVVFKTKITKDSDLIQIPLMTLNGLNEALFANVKGQLKNQSRKNEYVIDDKTEIRYEKSWVPDIKYDLKLGQKEKKKVFKSYTIAGILNLDGYARDNIIKGNLNIDRMYLDNGNFTRVNNIQLDFPFEHNTRFKKSFNLTAANKERIIKNFDKDLTYNFTVDSVEIPNPTRIKEPLKIIYPGGGYSGISASMRYKDNAFEMPMMQIFMLNGLATVQDTVFNVATGKSKDMEYRTLVQIKDIDFKQLIPADKAESIKDGKISADMLLTASSMKNMLANTNGYISIYKIGRQFARQGVKIVMPESSPLISFVVDEWTIIHKFDIELKEGLAYAKILYTKGTLGNIVGLEGNEIVQERRPIAELWQKAGEEVKIYQSDNIPQAESENQ